ncbi:MAG: LysR family transcriptional regulator [Myxococcota bacterium]
MNWDDLRFFLAVCRHGSVTGAGKQLGVTHTTVARRIAAFEESVGTRLFDRTRDGYGMTQSAEDIYHRAEAVEVSLIDIERSVFGRDAELKGPLKLTAPDHLTDVVIAPHMSKLRQMHPGIELELLSTTAVLDLDARQADLALRITRAPPDYLIGRKIVPVELGAYASASYIEEHEGSPEFILYRADTESKWMQLFPPGEVALRVEGVSTVYAAVKNGVGIGWLPCFFADVDPELRRIETPTSPTEWGLWILNHVDLRGTARVRAVREFLVETIEGQRDLIMGKHSRLAKLR